MKDEVELSAAIISIIPKIQPYLWGDDYFIPSLLGVKSHGTPQAEIWFGTHPGGESTLPDGTQLGDFLRDHAAQYFGQNQLDHSGKELPFLLKVLAIAKPLSLQVHPNNEQAKKGFAEEVADHINLPRDQWNYKDEHQKAEVLYALTPVTALCGFLPYTQVRTHMMKLIPKHAPLVFPAESAEITDDEVSQLETFFTTLYTLEKEQLHTLLAEYKESLESSDEPDETEDGNWLTASGIARTCLAYYPEDPGVLAPFFLNVLNLQPGEAIYLEPRTLHSYIRGHGVELMSNSDNVLRAGLTHKKINVLELLRTLSFKPQEILPCPIIREKSYRKTILAPTDDFILGVYETGDFTVDDRDSIEFLFCCEGSATLTAHEVQYELPQGSCLIVASCIKNYSLTVDGLVFSASLPR